MNPERIAERIAERHAERRLHRLYKSKRFFLLGELRTKFVEMEGWPQSGHSKGKTMANEMEPLGELDEEQTGEEYGAWV